MRAAALMKNGSGGGEHGARDANGATAEEDAESTVLGKENASSCPLVYVYNYSELQRHVRALTLTGYGTRLPTRAPWMRATQQHRLGAIILSRLLRFRRCVTFDASKAALFLVPLLHLLHPVEITEVERAAESNIVWEKMPPTTAKQLWPLCSRLLYDNWHQVLPHLSDASVLRHIFVNEQNFQIMGFCPNMPEFREQLQNAPNRAFLDSMTKWGNSAIQGYYSLAYPSLVHLQKGDDPPWRAGASERPILMMLGASTSGRPFARKLRSFLAAKCAEYGPKL